jgi:hypothetical protein
LKFLATPSENKVLDARGMDCREKVGDVKSLSAIRRGIRIGNQITEILVDDLL